MADRSGVPVDPGESADDEWIRPTPEQRRLVGLALRDPGALRSRDEELGLEVDLWPDVIQVLAMEVIRVSMLIEEELRPTLRAVGAMQSGFLGLSRDGFEDEEPELAELLNRLRRTGATIRASAGLEMIDEGPR